MNKLKYIFFSVVSLALLSISAFAQGAADNASTVEAYTALGTGLGVLGFGHGARHSSLPFGGWNLYMHDIFRDWICT